METVAKSSSNKWRPKFLRNLLNLTAKISSINSAILLKNR